MSGGLFSVNLKQAALTSSYVNLAHRETGVEVDEIIRLSNEVSLQLSESVPLYEYEAAVHAEVLKHETARVSSGSSYLSEYLHERDPLTEPVVQMMTASEAFSLLVNVGVGNMSHVVFVVSASAEVMVPAYQDIGVEQSIGPRAVPDAPEGDQHEETGDE